MDIQTVFKEARKTFDENTYPSVTSRIKNINKVIALLKENASLISDAIDKDYAGRAKIETKLLEIFPSIQALKFSKKNIRQWTKPKRRALGPWLVPARAKILPQPKGVVGFVVPWNYPLYLTISPLANAMAAGNVVMVKLSEQSHHLTELLLRLFNEYQIERVSITGGDVEVAKSFCALPFDHLLYTGSGRVARSVLQEASNHLTPVTLELGGKSPVIVGRTAKTSFYERIVMGKSLNSGQTCIAPDYVFLPKENKDKFILEAKKVFNQRYPDFENNPDYSAIITEKNKIRIDALIQDAKSKGADILPLAKRDVSKKIVPPTLLLNVNENMSVLQEEIFGPLLPVILYDTFYEVITYIKRHDRPLAIYYFGTDKQEMDRIKKETHSGSFTINDTLIQAAADNLPFGGIGASGMGQYHGKEGFETFSKMKPIFKQGSISLFSILYPPYGSLVRLFLKAVAGIR